MSDSDSATVPGTAKSDPWYYIDLVEDIPDALAVVRWLKINLSAKNWLLEEKVPEKFNLVVTAHSHTSPDGLAAQSTSVQPEMTRTELCVRLQKKNAKTVTLYPCVCESALLSSSFSSPSNCQYYWYPYTFGPISAIEFITELKKSIGM